MYSGARDWTVEIINSSGLHRVVPKIISRKMEKSEKVKRGEKDLIWERKED